MKKLMFTAALACLWLVAGKPAASQSPASGSVKVAREAATFAGGTSLTADLTGFQPKIQPFQSPEPSAGAEPGEAEKTDKQTTEAPLSSPEPINTGGATSSINSSYADRPAELYVTIDVPHNSNPKDSFTVFPYPVKPLKRFKEIKPLATKPQDLKGMLLTAGYVERWHGDQPYPPGGWRFQYAFNAACRASGKPLPHSVLSMYQWIDSMIPYLIPEVKRINKAEELRKARYDAAGDEYEQSRDEIYNDVTRKGLFAIGLRFYRKGRAYVRLPAPGTWWLAGTRSVPGLLYYWQIPISLAPASRQNLVLNEANALVIQGGW